jgi:hypothetical protein
MKHQTLKKASGANIEQSIAGKMSRGMAELIEGAGQGQRSRAGAIQTNRGKTL